MWAKITIRISLRDDVPLRWPSCGNYSPAGTRIRKKVSGRTKAEVRDKLRELHQQVGSRLRPRRRYTVGDALEDWLAHGLDGLSARTGTLYRDAIAEAL